MDIAQKINTMIDYKVILSLLNYDEKDKRHNLLTVIDNRHSASEAKAKKIYLEPSFNKDGEVISMWHGTNFSASEDRFGVVLNPLDFYICEKYYPDMTWTEYKALDRQAVKDNYNNAILDLSKFIDGENLEEVKTILEKAKKEKYKGTLTKEERHAFLFNKLASSLMRNEENRIKISDTYNYLHKERHIPSEILNRLFKDNFIYQGRLENSNIIEALFVGKYEDGKFACVDHRSCSKEIKVNGAWKNSDKKIAYPYFPDAKQPRNEPDTKKRLICFEAPIDMMSFMGVLQINGIDWTNYNYVATGGCGNRTPVLRLAEMYGFSNIGLCFDNDEQGLKGMKILEEKLNESSIYAEILVPEHSYSEGNEEYIVKDWNERLCLFYEKGVQFSDEEKNRLNQFLNDIENDVVISKEFKQESDINTDNRKDEMEVNIMAQKETVKMKGNVGSTPNVSEDSRYAYVNVAVHKEGENESQWVRLYAKSEDVVEILKKTNKGDFIEFEGSFQKEYSYTSKGKEYTQPQYKVNSLKNYTLAKNEREKSTAKFCGNMVKDVEVKEGEQYKYFDVAVHEKENSNDVTYYHCYTNNGAVLDMLGQSMKGDLVQLEGVPKEAKRRDGSSITQFDISSFRVLYRKQENRIEMSDASNLPQEMEEFPVEDSDDLCQE